METSQQVGLPPDDPCGSLPQLLQYFQLTAQANISQKCRRAVVKAHGSGCCSYSLSSSRVFAESLASEISNYIGKGYSQSWTNQPLTVSKEATK